MLFLVKLFLTEKKIAWETFQRLKGEQEQMKLGDY